jgi:hypothetical protein
VTIVDVVVPTLGVVLSWLGIGAVLACCGSLVRRVLMRPWPGSAAEEFVVADLWLGLAVLLLYLQLWSVVLSITWATWVAPIAAVPVRLLLGAGRLRSDRLARAPLAVFALVGVGVFWLANQALAAATQYDLGLYHLGIVEYALRYPAVPGLGNLQSRLGAGDAHLLFVSLLERGPWASAALHIANGLLAAMLFVEVGRRVAGNWEARATGFTFTTRLALLLVPATIVVIGMAPSSRLSSPNLDFAAFVLVMVGMLYLAECFEDGFRPTSVLTATALLALASATRPLYWIEAVVALVLVSFGLRRGDASERRSVVFRASLAWTIPIVLLIGWMIRQAILSGYPFFPRTLFALPVDWRVPASVARSDQDVIAAWARDPGLPPSEVLHSWHWLTGWWLQARLRDPALIAPLTLLACFVPALYRQRESSEPARATNLGPMLAVVLPSLLVLIAWFVTAPDPRFAFAPIWLIPAALVAWALPAARLRIPDTAGALLRVLPHALVVASMLGAIGYVAGEGAFLPVVADGSGPLGTHPEPKAKVTSFRTRSGLKLLRTTRGTDQCWATFLCTPYPNSALRLRAATVADGFTVNR